MSSPTATTTTPDLTEFLAARGLDLAPGVLSYALDVHRLAQEVPPPSDDCDRGRVFTDILRLAQDHARTVESRRGLSKALARRVRSAIAAHIVNGSAAN